MKQGLQIVRIIFWLIVFFLSITDRMMLAMDLMAAGMLFEAVCHLNHHPKSGTH